MGTPDFAVPALQTLLNSEHEVVCVYSQPPRPKGRGQKLQPSPVHQLAESAEIEVMTPENFKTKSAIRAFQDFDLDLAIVAAYGLILPRDVLKAPKYGCVNIHASLLPRWRGAAPIHRAILSGDKKTGVTLMKMDEGLDTGDMIAMEEVAITQNTTLPDLHDALAQLGADMLPAFLTSLQASGKITAKAQPADGITYASMLKKEDGRIDWTQDAPAIARQVRALNPWPGTWTVKGEQRFKMLQVSISPKQTDALPGRVLDGGAVACGQGGVIQIERLQPENKQAMDISAALNGHYLAAGDVFS
jgi:methionyl-tRNA formyltransferase